MASYVKVKICGITNLEDAQAATDMGADILGFNFFPKSPRYISPDAARGIIAKIPGFVDTAGVFVNPEYDVVHDLYEDGYLTWVQLHGDETPETCDNFSNMHTRTIKAIRVRDYDDIRRAQDYHTDAILFDAYQLEKYGGTGERFDWQMLSDMGRRIFLAGGITADNAVEAIETGVYGIDLCSGLEKKPGKKDHKKMQRFFDNIKHMRL